MHEKSIGNALEPQECLLILTCNRLLAEIGAGHHQNIKSIIEKQGVKRCIGQHDAKPIITWSYRWGYSTALFLFEKHYGRLRSVQCGTLSLTNLAVPLDKRHIAHHDGKRFGFTPLPLPQPAHRSLISTIYGKMKASKPFERNNQPLFEKSHSFGDSIAWQGWAA